MNRVIIDASVVIKWSEPEVHSADALRDLDPDLERDVPDHVAIGFPPASVGFRPNALAS